MEGSSGSQNVNFDGDSKLQENTRSATEVFALVIFVQAFTAEALALQSSAPSILQFNLVLRTVLSVHLVYAVDPMQHMQI